MPLFSQTPLLPCQPPAIVCVKRTSSHRQDSLGATTLPPSQPDDYFPGTPTVKTLQQGWNSQCRHADQAQGRVDGPEERKAAVQEANGVGDQQSLIRHAQDGDENGRRGVRAPEDRDEREHVAQRATGRRLQSRFVSTLLRAASRLEEEKLTPCRRPCLLFRDRPWEASSSRARSPSGTRRCLGLT